MKEVQILKGACREFEAECVWGYIGWQLPNISHLRLGFYTADIFAPEPTQQRDVVPVLKPGLHSTNWYLQCPFQGPCNYIA